MLRSTFVCVAVGFVVAFGSVARATPVPGIVLADGNVLNVQDVVGSGANTSYEVIDFADTGGPSFAWEYKYDTPVSGYQMLLNIAAADSNLTVDSQFFASFNEFEINNFTYGANSGNVNDFWRYLNGAYDSSSKAVTWADSNSGAGDVMISNGSFDGWYNNFDVADLPPTVPETPLPEPGAMGNLVILGSVCLLFIRKPRTVAARSR